MKNRGYFDYNATTPLSESVRRAMFSAMETFENPSAAYADPEGAKRIMSQARLDIADLIGAKPEQIFFTSGATESNNWVLRSILEESPEASCFVTSAIEHDATLAAGKMICDQYGHDMRIVQPDTTGIVSPSSVEGACASQVSLISIMLANNETGAIQPIQQIAAIALSKRAFFHVDAVQAAGKLEVDVEELGCDSLSLSGHKFHGPKGIGVLYLKDPSRLAPMIVGGGQENGLRAGTENIVGIAGMGVAAADAKFNLSIHLKHIKELRAALLLALSRYDVAYSINGPTDLQKTVASTLNLSFHGVRAEALAARLNLCNGISVSLGSACSTNKDRRHSHVLQSMGLCEDRLVSALRISFGKDTNLSDIEILAAAISDGLRVIQSLAAAE